VQRRLIGFILLVLLPGMLKPFPVHWSGVATAAAGRPANGHIRGGCFWCMVRPFEVIDGVISTISGYTGGSVANPTYEQVSAGGTDS
jgi:Peptide methionine sulfoxide reductase